MFLTIILSYFFALVHCSPLITPSHESLKASHEARGIPMGSNLIGATPDEPGTTVPEATVPETTERRRTGLQRLMEEETNDGSVVEYNIENPDEERDWVQSLEGLELLRFRVKPGGTSLLYINQENICFMQRPRQVNSQTLLQTFDTDPLRSAITQLRNSELPLDSTTIVTLGNDIIDDQASNEWDEALREYIMRHTTRSQFPEDKLYSAKLRTPPNVETDIAIEIDTSRFSRSIEMYVSTYNGDRQFLSQGQMDTPAGWLVTYTTWRT